MLVNKKNNHDVMMMDVSCLSTIKEYKSKKCNHQESWLELVEVG